MCRLVLPSDERLEGECDVLMKPEASWLGNLPVKITCDRGGRCLALVMSGMVNHGKGSTEVNEATDRPFPLVYNF